MSEPRKVRWGVIGATARVARDSTIPAILAAGHAELVAVASRNLANAQEVAGDCADCRAYGNYDALLADCDVDVVYIPLPNSLHVGWAIEAMNNGKHVLCEQPIAMTAAEALEMLETSQENGVILSEAMMFYYHTLRRTLHDIIERGDIGDVTHVKATVSFVENDPADYHRDPRRGGGALLDAGSHAVHAARKSFRAEPTAVTAKSTIDEDAGIDTSTLATLEFPGGTAEIDCSFSSTSQSRLEITGTKGSIVVPQMFLPAGAPVFMTVTKDGGSPEEITADRCDMFCEEVEAFSRTVLGEECGLLGPEDAVANMVVLDAIASAARSGRHVTLVA